MRLLSPQGYTRPYRTSLRKLNRAQNSRVRVLDRFFWQNTCYNTCPNQYSACSYPCPSYEACTVNHNTWWIYINTRTPTVRGVVDSVVPAAIRLFEPYGPKGARERARLPFLSPPYNLMTPYHASRSSVTTRDVEFEPAGASWLRRGWRRRRRGRKG